jgi:ribonuclease HI
MTKVVIYTDGACQGNPGPGGYAALLMYKGKEKMLQGGEKDSTNNRMELLACVEALFHLKESCEVDLWTDSRYVKDGITVWSKNWVKNGWKSASKKPVKNKDLWQRLLDASARHQVKWYWVKGHSGHDLNDRVDLAAKEAVGKYE